MKSHGLFAAACLPSFLIGCANVSLISANAPDWPWQNDNFCKTQTCTEHDALSAFVTASSFCRQVENYYESGGQRSNATKLGIGVIGTLAGAVFAPIAKGTSSTAWSGLSGATNGIQTAFEESFSANIAVNRRIAVVAAAANGEEAFARASDPYAKIRTAVSMARSCATSSALADQKILQSMSQDPKPEKSLLQAAPNSVPGNTPFNVAPVAPGSSATPGS